MKLSLLAFVSVAVSVPFKRDDSSSTSIQLIQTEDPQYDPSEIAGTLTDQLLSLFYSNTSTSWSDLCSSGGSPVVWAVAVAGKALADSEDSDNLKKAIDSLENYRNPSGGYSASTNKDNDIYTDDDSQVAWVYTDAYLQTFEQDYLKENENITSFLSKYVNDEGAVQWLINGGYVALISNLEVAVASLRVYLNGHESKYKDIAKKTIGYTLDNLVDPNDKFIYDGVDAQGNVNRGKLTYTIGTLISGCALLARIGDTDRDWQSIAVENGVRFISGGALNNQFYTNGHINDIIERSHLVYVGFADLLKNTAPSSAYQRQAYDAFEQLLVRESRHLYDTYTSVVTSSACPQNEYNTLIKYASLAQVFYETARVVDKI